jgi:hypothetical protein
MTDNTKKDSNGIVDWLIFGTPAAVLAFLWLAFEVSSSLDSPLRSAVQLHYGEDGRPTGQFEIAPWLTLLIVMLAYGSASLFAYAVKMKTKNGDIKHRVSTLETELGEVKAHVELERSRLQELTAFRTRAEKELFGMIRAVRAIVNKLYLIERPRWRFTTVRTKYRIDGEGNGTVEHLYHIEAGPVPAQVWKVDISADQTAEDVGWLDEISLTVDSLDLVEGKDVQYLLFVNEPKVKKIAIFFLPEIVSGETRKIRITYRWQGFARDLITRNETTFLHSFKTCDPADAADVECIYEFADTLGRVSVTSDFPRTPADVLVALPPDVDNGYQRWMLANPSMHMDDRRIALIARRTEATTVTA